MTPFAEKARHWPRIETAGQLAARLNNVRPRQWRHYQYAAEPPCHDSKSRNSFQFGDHPQGGLALTCWACQIPGARGWLDRLEEILHVALQVRYDSGAMRYSGDGGAPARQPRRASPIKRGAPTMYQERATLADLKNTPMWIAARGRAPWQGVAPDQGRLISQAYRQSMPDAGGDGLALARYGGQVTVYRPQGEHAVVRIRPWQTLPEVTAFITGITNPQEVRPALVLSGSPEHPSPMGLAAIDCDYDPEMDQTQAAAERRDRLRELCAAAGAAVYQSSGGHGFHALFLLSPETGLLHRRQTRRICPRAPGLAVETFLSGARRMLTVRLDQPLANAADRHRLPAVTPPQLAELVRKALA